MTPSAASTFTFTDEIFAKLAKMPPKLRRKTIAAIGELEWKRCAEDPLYWLDTNRHPPFTYVYTNERHPMFECGRCSDNIGHHFNKLQDHLKSYHEVKTSSVLETRAHFRELPGNRPFTVYEYMPPIIDRWMNDQIVLVEKSRDMMMTWLFVSLYTWDTLFHRNRQNIIQSEDASKTTELIERAYFIWKHQPKWLRDIHKANFAVGSNRSGNIKVPSLDSELLGFPQGPDEIRQYHPTGVLTDETAFQIDAGSSFAAIKPAIQAGGRYTGVSSANPSWFMLACQDRTDEEL